MGYFVAGGFCHGTYVTGDFVVDPKEVIDVKPHAKVNVMRRSYSDVPEVADGGNTAPEVHARRKVKERKSTPAAEGKS